MQEKRERTQRLKCGTEKEVGSPDSSVSAADGVSRSWGTCVPRFDVGTFIQLRFPCLGAKLLVYNANECNSFF